MEAVLDGSWKCQTERNGDKRFGFPSIGTVRKFADSQGLQGAEVIVADRRLGVGESLAPKE